jgi:hypothetical protein
MVRRKVDQASGSLQMANKAFKYVRGNQKQPEQNG